MIKPENIVKYYKGFPFQQKAITEVAKTWTDEQWAIFKQYWYNDTYPEVPITTITASMLSAIADNGSPAENFEEFVEGANETCQKYCIHTPLRIAHFMAQIFHESGALQYREEIASGEDYEFRYDLGNTNPGDGVKYKGRSFIQITGRYNYAFISKDTGINFLDNPSLLASYRYAWLGAGWFWHRHNINVYADFDKFETITRIINGGLNGLDDRRKYLLNAKKLFNLLP